MQFLTISSDYEVARMISAAFLFLLAIITTCHNHKFRKMEKQNEELCKQVKKQEAELARLRQQKSGTGEKTE